MRGLTEIRANFQQAGPGGIPFWAVPVSATDPRPSIDFGRASEIGSVLGHTGGGRMRRFVGPFRRIAGDGDSTKLLHLGWVDLCRELCGVDRDEVLRARCQLLRLEGEWVAGGMMAVEFDDVADDLLSGTPSWLRERSIVVVRSLWGGSGSVRGTNFGSGSVQFSACRTPLNLTSQD